MSGCLGWRTAALADGRLPADERDRALAHAAACTRCQRELAEQRQARAALQALATPSLPDSWLAALAHDVPMESARPATVGSSRPLRRRPTRSRRNAVAAGGVGLAVAASLAIVGWSPRVEGGVPVVTPDITRLTVDHRAAAVSLAVLDPAAGIVVATSEDVGNRSARSRGTAGHGHPPVALPARNGRVGQWALTRLLDPP